MKKKPLLTLSLLFLVIILIVGCQAEPEVVEVTRVVTETVTEEGETVEVTRIVTEEVEVTRVVEVEVEGEQPVEDVTLTVWFLSGSPEEVELVQSLMDQWAASYEDANVTVDFSNYGFEDWNNAMKLALDGGSGPDVAYGSPGESFVNAWGAAGHLIDLTDIAAERGWTEKVPEDVMAYYNPEGVLWGIPYDAVTVGVYYNSEIFEEMGLSVPTTFTEFEQLLADLKAADVTPIAVGGQTWWTVVHIWDQLLHTNMPWDSLTAFDTLSPDWTTTEEMLQATEKLKEWADAGYFNEDAIAVSYPDGNALFITGQAAMNIGGTWNNSSFASEPEFEVRFFAMPPMNPDLPEWHMGGFTPNNEWVIPVYGEHQTEALALLDYMIAGEESAEALALLDYMIAGEESATARWNNGDIVAYNFETPPDPVYPLQADVFNAMQLAMPGFYTHPNQEMNDTLAEAIQALVGGLQEPAAALEAIQETYDRLLTEAAEEDSG